MKSFFDATVSELAFPDTGSAADDFRAQLQQLADLLLSPRGGVLAALITGSRTDPDLVSATGNQWVRPRQCSGIARLKRAIDGRRCVSSLNVGVALDTLYSSLYAHLLPGLPVPSVKEIDRHCASSFRRSSRQANDIDGDD